MRKTLAAINPPVVNVKRLGATAATWTFPLILPVGVVIEMTAIPGAVLPGISIFTWPGEA